MAAHGQNWAVAAPWGVAHVTHFTLVLTAPYCFHPQPPSFVLSAWPLMAFKSTTPVLDFCSSFTQKTQSPHSNQVLCWAPRSMAHTVGILELHGKSLISLLMCEHWRGTLKSCSPSKFKWGLEGKAAPYTLGTPVLGTWRSRECEKDKCRLLSCGTSWHQGWNDLLCEWWRLHKAEDLESDRFGWSPGFATYLLCDHVGLLTFTGCLFPPL